MHRFYRDVAKGKIAEAFGACMPRCSYGTYGTGTVYVGVNLHT